METKLTAFSQRNLNVIENFILFYTHGEQHPHYEAMMKSAHDYILEDHVDGEDSPEARLEKEGYFIEWNGEHFQSVFPSDEAEKSSLHPNLQEAINYMVEQGVERSKIQYEIV